MRSNIDPQKVEQIMDALGRAAKGPGRVYFTGGVSALLVGWRESTVDVDVRLDPEPSGIFQAIAKIKNELGINIELASPQDFLPPLPGWQDRSVYIGKRGQISFYHYDFTAQALSKLSRGYERDENDVKAMLHRKLFSIETLRDSFEAIEPDLIRYPSLDPKDIKAKVTGFIQKIEETSSDGDE